MVIGSSWTNPPKEWKVTKSLKNTLSKLKAVQTLKIFVELDPSHPVFARYRKSLDFYTDFCGDLLKDILTVMPQLKFVELDGNPSVQLKGPLISRLRQEAEEQHKVIKWGKERNWAHDSLAYVVG